MNASKLAMFGPTVDAPNLFLAGFVDDALRMVLAGECVVQGAQPGERRTGRPARDGMGEHHRGG
ncbi:hypothetical protein [Mycobacterium lacus]|uniref:hypothetical protein n=1 Tax=Mycobacterium lacus TaxID=169765 RepID=UPI00111C30B6|nr:hypothetical protein [Mycobacterium lacus]MCV7122094.1 hypothetical protein [Mycobacterium lacus]